MIETVAEAMWRVNGNDRMSWADEHVSEIVKDRYRRMAQAAIDAMKPYEVES